MNRFIKLFSLLQGEEDKNKVREDVISNISFKGANLWILACAIFVASIGLNVNSTAVIIGAMLISPLMGPIVGSGFALATYDFDLLKRSGKNLLIATFVGLIVSCIYFYISPFKEVQSEILSRTSPTIYDVLIAFFGGIVGAIAITRVEKGNPIPGVAIATALMPPLCTAGFGLATMNFKFVLGALYLYSINCFFIGISTFLIIKYLKYKPVETLNPRLDKRVRVIVTIVMCALVVPSFYLAYNLLQEKKYEENVDNYIQSEFIDKGYAIIYKKFNFKRNPKEIELAFLTKKFDSTEIKELNNELLAFNIKDTKLIIKQTSEYFSADNLSKINSDNIVISEKDLKISSLSKEINEFKIGDYDLSQEIKVIFPEIESISYGVTQSFITKDSVQFSKIVTYHSKSSINETKLKGWLKIKFNDPNLELIRK